MLSPFSPPNGPALSCLPVSVPGWNGRTPGELIRTRAAGRLEGRARQPAAAGQLQRLVGRPPDYSQRRTEALYGKYSEGNRASR
jgi:hypothetical protein